MKRIIGYTLHFRETINGRRTRWKPVLEIDGESSLPAYDFMAAYGAPTRRTGEWWLETRYEEQQESKNGTLPTDRH